MWCMCIARTLEVAYMYEMSPHLMISEKTTFSRRRYRNDVDRSSEVLNL